VSDPLSGVVSAAAPLPFQQPPGGSQATARESTIDPAQIQPQQVRDDRPDVFRGSLARVLVFGVAVAGVGVCSVLGMGYGSYGVWLGSRFCQTSALPLNSPSVM
jgi:hypothetical protein